ncbi:MAG: HRDC domain-containing protein [Elusimicrobia bacterium]|nr:HRDC domain-containing protein [Elusimicrobiota bacterium]
MESPALITDPRGLVELVSHLLSCPRVAVDTESNSFYAYYDRLCLIQFSTDKEDYIVDPLAAKDLSSLKELFASSQVEKVFHAAQEDIRFLRLELDFEFVNIFDTMISARILGFKEFGLAAMLSKHLQVSLNKKLQRSDWGRRPLTPGQIQYAAEDTSHLLNLRDLLYRQLTEKGLWEEAREEFERVAAVKSEPRQFDPEGFRWIDGARDLDGQGLTVLREIYIRRDQQGRKMNRPVFMILSDALLVRLARARPSDPPQLKQISGVTPYILNRHGPWILEGIEQGKKAPPVGPWKGSPVPRMNEEELARYERLRSWRNQKAVGRGVEADVVLSNAVLKRLACLPSALSELSPRKLAAYGEELLKILKEEEVGQ